MYWGLPHRNEKENGTQERVVCLWEPELRKEGNSWLQMHLAAVVGTQPSLATMVLRVPSRRKGAVYVNWKDWFTEVGSTLGSKPPSWDMLAFWLAAPSPLSVTVYILRLWSYNGLMNTDSILCLLWISCRTTQKQRRENSTQPIETDSSGLGCTAVKRLKVEKGGRPRSS